MQMPQSETALLFAVPGTAAEWLPLLLLWVALMSACSFLLFGLDKRRAKKGGWRVPERTLFLSALLGGSPGAILGMKYFHHKTLHKRFRYGLPAILALQAVLIALFFTHYLR